MLGEILKDYDFITTLEYSGILKISLIIITLDYLVCLEERVSRRRLSWIDLNKPESKYNDLNLSEKIQLAFKYKLDRPKQAKL